MPSCELELDFAGSAEGLEVRVAEGLEVEVAEGLEVGVAEGLEVEVAEGLEVEVGTTVVGVVLNPTIA
jgi:hypothetical protein